MSQNKRVSLRIIFLISVFMVLCSDVFAQIPDSSKRNKSRLKNLLGVTFGLSDFHVREEMASPLTYRNIGITGSLEYIRLGNNYKHHIELTGYYDILETAFSKYEAENGRVGVRYNYLHQISEMDIFKNSLWIYIGGGIYSFLNYSHYKEYISSIGILNYTWYLSHSAELSVLMDYSTTIFSNLIFQFYLPLVSNVSRPTYSGYDPESHKSGINKLFGETVAFWKNPVIQLKIGYNYNINDWFSIFAQYDFQYSSYGEPRNIGMYMNNFKGGAYFTF